MTLLDTMPSHSTAAPIMWKREDEFQSLQTVIGNLRFNSLPILET
jgi:hypothetical protein